MDNGYIVRFIRKDEKADEEYYYLAYSASAIIIKITSTISFLIIHAIVYNCKCLFVNLRRAIHVLKIEDNIW